jgi:hypothetical protein
LAAWFWAVTSSGRYRAFPLANRSKIVVALCRIVVIAIPITVLNIGDIDGDVFGVLARLAGSISKLARPAILGGGG